jgi:hypothetical protein
METLKIKNLHQPDFQHRLKALKAYKILFVISYCIFFTNCTPSDSEQIDTEPVLKSPTDKISGTYTGIGKKMPNGVYLGNFSGCVTPPNWESNFVTGSSIVTVTKVDDYAVNMKISGGAITTETYSNVAVTENNGNISFLFGNYNILSGSFIFSARTNDAGYITTNACLQGLPYYSGWSALINGVYGYSTIGHIDFAGTKQ